MLRRCLVRDAAVHTVAVTSVVEVVIDYIADTIAHVHAEIAHVVEVTVCMETATVYMHHFKFIGQPLKKR